MSLQDLRTVHRQNALQFLKTVFSSLPGQKLTGFSVGYARYCLQVQAPVQEVLPNLGCDALLTHNDFSTLSLSKLQAFFLLKIKRNLFYFLQLYFFCQKFHLPQQPASTRDAPSQPACLAASAAAFAAFTHRQRHGPATRHASQATLASDGHHPGTAHQCRTDRTGRLCLRSV